MIKNQIEKRIFYLIDAVKGIYHKYFKNRYVTATVVFLVWILFFDNDSLIRQVQRKIQISKLEKEYNYYQKELAETKIEQKALFENDDYFEKFVREKYLLKKENEDLFIFSEN